MTLSPPANRATTTAFTRTTFGSSGIPVCRLGLSASYWPGRKTIHHALDHGVNLFFSYGFDGQMTRALRETFRSRRQDIVLVTGAYNLIWGHFSIRRSLEKRLRQFGTDYVDAFLFLGVMKAKQMPEAVIEELCRLRDEGKARTIGLSCHDRKFAGKLAANSPLDAFMIRYNAAHRGAEQDIFPQLAARDPGVISYTATRWRHLLRPPKGWQKEKPVPTAAQCYRFVLSNPHVHVCLTAPANLRQFQENLAALESGPLPEDEMSFMREFGDAVYHRNRYFM